MPIVEGPAVSGNTSGGDPLAEGDTVTIQWPGDADNGRVGTVSYLAHVVFEDGTERHVPRVALRKEN